VLGVLLALRAGESRAGAALSADIAPQPLAAALAEFAHQTGLQFIYVSRLARERSSKGAHGGLAPGAAISELLEGTGLGFEFLNDRTVHIFESTKSKAAARQSDKGVAGRGVDSRTTAPTSMEEFIVTGSRGVEALSQVPVSIGVWTRQQLEMSGAKDVATIANLTPGVEFDAYPDYSAGIETNIAIRGVDAKDGSTTAIYFDDIPVPSDRASSFGRAYPVMFDLDRIEVVRGPQGVLFGEGAEGGAVRFVGAQPSLINYSAYASGEVLATARGAPTYEAGAAAGGPLIADAVGARVGAWMRREGGFVDRVDPFTGATVDANANRSHSEAAKAAIAFAPTDSLVITPSIAYQSVDLHDSSAFYTYLSDPANGVLKSGKLLQQWANDRHYLLSLKATAALTGVNLSMVTGYFRRHALAMQDQTNVAYWRWPNPLGDEYPVSYADARPDIIGIDQITLSQQVRLASSNNSERLSWVAGALYLYGHNVGAQDIGTAALADGGALNGWTVTYRTTTQLAVFGQIDWQLRGRLRATLGARLEHDSYHSLAQLNFQSVEYFAVDGAATPVTPHFGLAYQGAGTGLYYATVAKGYRGGGPNASIGAACAVSTPLAYGPDFVWSYELGAKNSLLDARLQIDASLFHISWHDVQVQIPVPECGICYTINAGAAASDGFDFGLRARLPKHIQVDATVAYASAHYTKTVISDNAVVVGKGDAIGVLPLVTAPWMATASVIYEFALPGGVRASLQAQDAFHSRNPGPFTSDNPAALVFAPTRRPNPSTNLLNLRAQVTWAHFYLSVFVNNALDSQPTLQRRNYVPTDTLFYATTFRPRTIGIATNWHY
jgi:iron complex outermembrane receptor protein